MKKDIKENGLNNVINNIIENDKFNNIINVAAQENIVNQFQNTRFNLLTFDPILLTEKYVSNGIFKTLVQQPVLDGMRGELEIESENLTIEEIEELKYNLEQKNVFEVVKEAFFWKRLYGGGAIIIEKEGENTEEEFNIKNVRQGDKINFYSTNRWELSNFNLEEKNINFNDKVIFKNLTINKSRLIILKGEVAPYYVDKFLNGWGLSCLETVITPSNIYNSTVNLIYELISEGKLDILKIENLNEQLGMNEGEEFIQKKVNLLAKLKNYKTVLALDNNEDFQQKQLSFAGLVEILREYKLDICASMKMPITKIYGLSASGFNSGMDDIKNYNAMVESEVRNDIYKVLKKIINIICKTLFDYVPKDLKINYPKLEQLDNLQIADLRQKDFTIAKTLFDSKAINYQEFFDFLKKKEIFVQNTIKSESQEYSSNEEAQQVDKLEL